MEVMPQKEDSAPWPSPEFSCDSSALMFLFLQLQAHHWMCSLQGTLGFLFPSGFILQIIYFSRVTEHLPSPNVVIQQQEERNRPVLTMTSQRGENRQEGQC